MSGSENLLLSEATKQFIFNHRFGDVKQLALSNRANADPDVDMTVAITQIAGRQAIKDKIPSWYGTEDLLYPSKLSLEQCSSEATARYKASLLAGTTFTDLTGGLGVDFSFISKKFRRTVYVERHPELCSIARHNFSVLNLGNTSVINDQAAHYLQQMDFVDCIYMDPARRNHTGKKVVAISDCEPDINQIKNLLMEKSACVLIKLSPMLDISLALQTLKETSEVHVVSVDNECKELLFLLKKEWNEEAAVYCVNLVKNEIQKPLIFKKSEEKEAVIEYTAEVKDFLYEPNTSLLKAGAFRVTANRYQLQKLHPDSHLYTSSQYIPDFPGRCLKVEAVSSFNKNELKIKLQHLKQANLSVRNFPVSVEELKKKLKIKDGGGDYLFATTLNDAKRILILGKKMIKHW